MAENKKSIVQVGSWLFLHGGFSHALAQKCTIHEINALVKKWLLKQSTPQEDQIFDPAYLHLIHLLPFIFRVFIF